MKFLLADQLISIAANLKLLILDVDGVLTSGHLLLAESDVEIKQFHFHDGLGVMLLRTAGIKIALMSDRTSRALERRAREMSVDDISPVINGNKEESLRNLLTRFSLTADEVGYMGDDLRDIPPMRLVALPIAVANARPEVKDCSVHITSSSGGDGAVREAAEWILELRGQKDEIIGSIIKLSD